MIKSEERGRSKGFKLGCKGNIPLKGITLMPYTEFGMNLTGRAAELGISGSA